MGSANSCRESPCTAAFHRIEPEEHCVEVTGSRQLSPDPSYAERSKQMRSSVSIADTHFDEKRLEVMQRVIDGSTYKQEANDLEVVGPTAAMQTIFNHLHLDPDGGLMNLCSAQKTGQASKAEALRGGPLRATMALVFLLRCVVNVAKVLHLSWSHGLSYFIFEGHAHYLNERYRHVNYRRVFSVDIRIDHLVVAMSALEGLAVAVVLVLIFCDILKACCDSGPPKFRRFARILWTEVPRLASLSAMRGMSYVHPNLLVKNSKTFDLRQKAARTKLDSFFKGKLDGHSNEEVAVQVAKVVLCSGLRQPNRSREENRKQLLEDANAMIDETPMQLFDAVRQRLSGMEGEERGDLIQKFDVEPRVFDNMWRLSLVTFLELGTFVLIVAAAFVIGFGGVLAKLAEGSVLLTAPDERPQIVLFWFVAFVNQLLSVMTVEELLIWRVEAFIFGGCDALVSAEERYIISTYRGHLLEKIWASDVFNFLDKLVISVQLHDDDLQRLVVEEDHGAKTRTLASVKRHMQGKKAV